MAKINLGVGHADLLAIEITSSAGLLMRIKFFGIIMKQSHIAMRFFIVVTIVAIFPPTNAQDKNAPQTIEAKEPNHLEPIDPYAYDSAGYPQIVLSSLIGNV
jgi:hypothetical protein